MDNVLIVVDDLAAAKSFFIELGLELEGETQVEGASVDSLIGLKGVRATLAFMRTPDGHGRIELDKFHTPDAIRFGPVDTPVNTLGIRRFMFAVEDIDTLVARVCAHGAELIGEVVQYEDAHRLAYIRGPEGIIAGLSEQIGCPGPLPRRPRPRLDSVDQLHPAVPERPVDHLVVVQGDEQVAGALADALLQQLGYAAVEVALLLDGAAALQRELDEDVALVALASHEVGIEAQIDGLVLGDDLEAVVVGDVDRLGHRLVDGVSDRGAFLGRAALHEIDAD